MRKRTSWPLSITLKRRQRVADIARALRKQTGDNISEPEAVGILIDEKFEALGLVDNEEPAVSPAGAMDGENVAGS